MNDLNERLARFAGPVPAASDDTIAADVARGHRAVRRRRTARVAAGSAFGIAALAAAVAVLGTTPAVRDGATEARPAIGATAETIRLVDYRGEQPKNFTIAKVPEGFFVQKDYYGGLTIAPDAARNPGPDVDPSVDPLYDPEIFTGKIAIFLENKFYRGELTGDTVTVAGKKAILHSIGPTTQLIISVSDDVYATIQADVPLTRDQLLELGAGLTVHQDAIDRQAGAKGIVKD
ncbi:hypothetical protein [Actinoplanes derwentensis]|uniref:Uncharacterized protein n=1 Tax=Actinoplanes derwentensis TaxID=113562 RepID=A0A1H1YMC8_9ACTN|nr:hypothetical protein [Actinoplanes derwentensis]GID81205.1 hypothetical protein Ade03nite_01290 [Actinoplanes derwentensis]SDT22542.1 hypothetical protein SAMN04489716_2914 [Actinoplanes derwentensis]